MAAIKTEKKALVACAKELNKVMGLKPPISVKGEAGDITEAILEEAGEIRWQDNEDGDADEFTEATLLTLSELGVEVPDELLEDEEDDEEEEVEDVEVDDDEEEEEESEEETDDKEEEEPEVTTKKKAPAKKKTAPKKKNEYRRLHAIADAINKVKKAGDTPENIAKVANDLFVKKDGADNYEETRKTLRWVTPILEHIGYISVNVDGKIKRS